MSLYLMVVLGTGILTTILVPEDLTGISHFILTVTRRLLHIEREGEIGHKEKERDDNRKI